MDTYVQAILPAISALYVIWILWKHSWRGTGYKSKAEVSRYKGEKENLNKFSGLNTSNQLIEPLRNFIWNQVKPLQLRPFKPKTHLTMALRNSSVSELIEMDWNYLNRIQLRRQIMAKNPDITLAADPSVTKAVEEFYSWIFGNYLPQRFPTMFQLRYKTSSTTQPVLQNLVTEEEIPLQPPESPLEALKIIGSHIEDDFLFLLPSNDNDGYRLQGFVTCFPSGFNTRKKLHMKLREIHEPVPGYKHKLEKSMDRFFDRLEVGKFIKRTNWTITTTPQLFTPSGTHSYPGEEPTEEVIDVKKTYMRVERQVLHRLPQTKALVFSFKTYLYPLSALKEEGVGEELANAIDGILLGTVPELWTYKRAAVWGDTVKEFLRGA